MQPDKIIYMRNKQLPPTKHGVAPIAVAECEWLDVKYTQPDRKLVLEDAGGLGTRNCSEVFEELGLDA